MCNYCPAYCSCVAKKYGNHVEAFAPRDEKVTLYWHEPCLACDRTGDFTGANEEIHPNIRAPAEFGMGNNSIVYTFTNVYASNDAKKETCRVTISVSGALRNKKITFTIL